MHNLRKTEMKVNSGRDVGCVQTCAQEVHSVSLTRLRFFCNLNLHFSGSDRLYDFEHDRVRAR